MLNQMLRGCSRKRSIAFATTVLLALAPVATLLAASPTSDEVPRVTVRFADLNLSTTQGAAALLRRIEFGARQVCGDGADRRRLAQWAVFRKCYSAAVARAVMDVGRPKLSDAYRAKYSVANAYPKVVGR
jgi:UrcA family protein